MVEQRGPTSEKVVTANGRQERRKGPKKRVTMIHLIHTDAAAEEHLTPFEQGIRDAVQRNPELTKKIGVFMEDTSMTAAQTAFINAKISAGSLPSEAMLDWHVKEYQERENGAEPYAEDVKRLGEVLSTGFYGRAREIADRTFAEYPGKLFLISEGHAEHTHVHIDKGPQPQTKRRGFFPKRKAEGPAPKSEEEMLEAMKERIVSLSSSLRARDTKIVQNIDEALARDDVAEVVGWVGAVHTPVGHELSRKYTVKRIFPDKQDGVFFYSPGQQLTRKATMDPEYIPTHAEITQTRLSHQAALSELKAEGAIPATYDRQGHDGAISQQIIRREYDWMKRQNTPEATPRLATVDIVAQTLRDREQDYARIKAEEARAAHPDYPFTLRIQPDQPEWAILKAAGMSAEKINSGTFTRQELLDAGFLFKNTLNSGEKGIISGKIPDPEDPEKEIDFTGRKLLTRAEVEMVYAYQQQHPEVYGLQGHDIDEVRNDMLSFMREAVRTDPFEYNNDFLRKALPYDRAQMGWEMDWEQDEADLIEKFWRAEEKKYVRSDQDPEKTRDSKWRAAWIRVRENFARTQLADLYTLKDEGTKTAYFNRKEVRGITTETKNMVRGGSVLNEPSPFLDSGFFFGRNIDIDLWMKEQTGDTEGVHRRLNVVNVHLIGAHPEFPGFSEMGTQGWDQRYMTPGEYVRELYPEDEAVRTAVQTQEATLAAQVLHIDKIIKESHVRLLAAVKKWDAERGILGLKEIFKRPASEYAPQAKNIVEGEDYGEALRVDSTETTVASGMPQLSSDNTPLAEIDLQIDWGGEGDPDLGAHKSL